MGKAKAVFGDMDVWMVLMSGCFSGWGRRWSGMLIWVVGLGTGVSGMEGDGLYVLCLLFEGG